jgi:hypothetical protein
VTVSKNFAINSSYVLIQRETILNKKSEILKMSFIFNEHSPNRTWTYCVLVVSWEKRKWLSTWVYSIYLHLHLQVFLALLMTGTE